MDVSHGGSVLFASFDFLLFFPAVFAGYWALSRHPTWRALWIVAASYLFYMAGPKPVDGPPPTRWYFIGLLLVSTTVDFVCGLRIAAAQERAAATGAPPPSALTGRRPGKLWVCVSVLTNLGMLAYFKYTGFLIDAVSDAAAALGFSPGLPTLRLLLPVGISFFTFQSMSYTIDLYRGRIPAERSALKYAFFISFFPQLVAGPIVRASTFLPQLQVRPRLERDDVDHALWRIGKGLVKKVLLGDFIAVSFTDRVFASPAEHTSLENLLGLYAFTLQIYADFSGYSDIAIGVARLLGFRIPENFDRPYQAVDVADFWRRWHMTLSAWLRDYVYYPLGGSRVGPVRSYLNLWVTMLLVGIWHGASWNFVIYANVQAAAMLFNRFCRRQSGSAGRRVARLLAVSLAVALATALLGWAGLGMTDPWALGLAGGALSLFIGLLPTVDEASALRPLHVLLTLHFSVLSRLFFRADTLESARAMARQLLEWDGFGVTPGLLGMEPLSRWLATQPALAWARPVADWGVLWLLLGGFALHYVPARRLELGALRVIPRVPSVLLGLGLAALFGVLGLLLSGPRANIYFAF